MPLPDHDVCDPRIKRTRQLLQSGLRNVLRRKPLEEILVQDITEAATVNRATFYDHYSDKFDLFNALIAADFQTFVKQRQLCISQCNAAGLDALVMAVGDFLQQMHADHAACTRQASSEPLMDAALTLAIRKIVLDSLSVHPGAFPLPHTVVASMVSGAIYNAVKESLSQRKWRADEVTLRSVVQMVLPFLKSNVAPGAVAIKTQNTTESTKRR